MTRKSTLAVAIAALLTPALAGALGLGTIQVNSALNEPLQARIPIRGASAEDFGNLRAKLGSQEQFERAGFDRPFILTKLRFKVIETESSNGYIQVTSKGPVAEPFLNFLIDVTWLSGRVIREYTLLLDPPVYGAAISSATKKRVTTVAKIPTGTAPVPAPKKQATGAVATVNSQAAPAATKAVDSYGPVKSGETLWSIATDVRPSSAVSIQEMMLAILKANSQAFNIDNVNALRTGSVLRIPAASDLRLGKAEALAEVARQHSLWREYRRSIGAPVAEPATAGQVTAKVPVATAGGAGTATSQDGAQGGTDSGELKLLAGSAQGSGSGTGSNEELQSLRDDLSMAREQADTAKNENLELKERLNKVEAIVTDLNRLVDLKADQLAALQAQLAKSQAAGASEASEPEPKPEPAPKPEPKPEPKPKPKPKSKPRVIEPPQPTSTMDVINELLPVPLWTLLAGLGALLLSVGGIGFMRKRRAAGEASSSGPAQLEEGGSMISQYAESEPPEEEDDDLLDAEAITEMPDVPAAASLGSEDITDIAAVADTAADDPTDLPAEVTESTGKMEAMESAAPEDDPLAEFNVYLAYESFDQAEQLARNAIAGAPDRHEYKSKLLEVFYASKNVPAYESAAKELQEAVGDDHEYMVQARDWWSDLGTGRELFSVGDSVGSGTAADDDVFDVTSTDTGVGEETGLDFDLGAGAESAGSADESDSSLDFDLGSLGDIGSASEEVADIAGGGTGLDFDLGGLEADAPDSDAAQISSSGDGTSLDFDLGGLDDDTSAASVSAPDATDDSGLDFDLGGLGDTDDSGAEPVQAAPELEGTSDLDFDLGETGTLTAEGAVSDAITEVNENQSLDLDLTQDDETAVPVNEADESQAGDAGVEDSGDGLDLDFDLSETMTVGDSLTDSSADEQDQMQPAVEEAAVGEAAVGEAIDAGLDIDLGSTGGEAQVPSEAVDEALETSLDLEATGGEISIQADFTDETQVPGLDLDMDLDATGGETAEQADATDEGQETSLDLGLGMNLEDTDGETAAEQADASEEGQETSLDLGLDMDLDATGGETAEQADGTDEVQDTGLDVGLDMDLDATGGEAETPAGATDGVQDVGPDLDFDLDATGGEVAAEDPAAAVAESGLDLGLDMELQVPEEADFQDAATEIGDISDPDLMEDLGIDIAGLGQATSIDTVQLDADDVAKMNIANSTDLDIGLDAGDGESEYGVDTQFKGIFPTDSANSADDSEQSSVDFDLGGDLQEPGIGAGTSSSVDFDLGADFESVEADSALADSIEDADGDAGEEEDIDMDATVFSLPNLPKPPEPQADADEADDDDEDDKTLVLGRSAATGSVDDMQTKLDLAQAYMETGDTEGARNLLGEVMAEGDDLQQATAREMLTKLS